LNLKISVKALIFETEITMFLKYGAGTKNYPDFLFTCNKEIIADMLPFIKKTYPLFMNKCKYIKTKETESKNLGF
jgi:hypothetical protein